MKLPKLTNLKSVIAQLASIKKDLASELSSIRNQIMQLQDENDKLLSYPLGREDAKSALLRNIDAFHNELKERMKSRSLACASATVNKYNGVHLASSGDLDISHLEAVTSGRSGDYMFPRMTGIDFSLRPYELVFLTSHESIKDMVENVFNDINDSEWPKCPNLSGDDLLQKMQSNREKIAELSIREQEIINEAKSAGVDIE